MACRLLLLPGRRGSWRAGPATPPSHCVRGASPGRFVFWRRSWDRVLRGVAFVARTPHPSALGARLPSVLPGRRHLRCRGRRRVDRDLARRPAGPRLARAALVARARDALRSRGGRDRRLPADLDAGLDQPPGALRATPDGALRGLDAGPARDARRRPPARGPGGGDRPRLPASLAAVLARTLWRTGQRRNYGIVALVGVLALANAAVHAQALGFTRAPRRGRCASPPIWSSS